MCASQGHGTDVNVISWNRLVNYLVVSGADDGSMRIWDLRSLSSGQPVARFHWHKAPITSVEWSPHESSTIAASAADDQLSLWDLALEVQRDHAEIAPRSRRGCTEVVPRSRRDRAEIAPRSREIAPRSREIAPPAQASFLHNGAPEWFRGRVAKVNLIFIFIFISSFSFLYSSPALGQP